MPEHNIVKIKGIAYGAKAEKHIMFIGERRHEEILAP